MDEDIQYRSRIFHVARLKYETPNGEQLTKDVVRHPGSVAILPVFDDGRICLIKNHRVTVSETLFEIPAGTMEPPEPPDQCARRELIEETGYRADVMELTTTFFPAPGILDEKMYLYLATGLHAGTPAREAGEEIENMIVSLDEALSMIQSGAIHDAKTMLSLLLFEKNTKNRCDKELHK